MTKTILFKDFPEFRPNQTPREMFKKGIMGGTYWRPIYSSITKKNYKNQHLKFPAVWWKNIPDHYINSEVCDVTVNKYKVKSGTSLEYWEDHGWITKQSPYGWIQWFLKFYNGVRSYDDERQINRWKAFVARHMGMLNSLQSKGKDSLKTKQNLLQWAWNHNFQI